MTGSKLKPERRRSAGSNGFELHGSVHVLPPCEMCRGPPMTSDPPGQAGEDGADELSHRDSRVTTMTNRDTRVAREKCRDGRTDEQGAASLFVPF